MIIKEYITKKNRKYQALLMANDSKCWKKKISSKNHKKKFFAIKKKQNKKIN